MAGGRPTDYSEDIIVKAHDYFVNYNKTYKDPIPSIEGLAICLGISRDTIYEWSSHEDKKEFTDIVNRLRTLKSRELQNGGVTKKFDGKITALLLGHEGYRDKKDITTNDKELPQPIINVLGDNSDTESDRNEEED